MRNYSEEIQNFYQYVFEFYNNKTGIYPIASELEIHAAVNQYLESKPLTELEFDSIDRESVRMIIEPSYSMWIT